MKSGSAAKVERPLWVPKAVGVAQPFHRAVGTDSALAEAGLKLVVPLRGLVPIAAFKMTRESMWLVSWNEESVGNQVNTAV
jgi:hypothetical protein